MLELNLPTLDLSVEVINVVDNRSIGIKGFVEMCSLITYNPYWNNVEFLSLNNCRIIYQ